ncbi:MAG: sulfotransferase family protein [Omnitrophica bacterium]|nr:sulfotransferase family protein [Candidatus Omnitrophota bacterium]
MVLHTHKLIFIHIPKCGGTSIEKKLNGFGKTECLCGWDKKNKFFLQHATCSELISLKLVDKKTFSSYFKCAFVRNPWDRYVSEYTWRIKYHNNFCEDKSIRDISFKDYLLKNFQWQEKSWEQHHRPQVDFILNKKNKLMIDFIGRFEYLQKDFDKICDILGIEKGKLPHDFKTNHMDYTKYYNNQTRQIVAEKCAKDIKYFGYKFRV